MLAVHVPGTGRLLRWAGWCALAFGLIVAGSAVVLRFAVWPNLAHWQPQIEHQLGQLVGRPVRIGALTTGFDGWRPWIVVTGVRVRDDDGVDALVIERLRAIPSIRSALRGRFGLALLESDGPSVRIERVAPQRLRIAGFELATDEPGGAGGLGWLLAQRRVVLRGARIELVDRVKARRTDLSGIDLVWGTRGRQLRASVRIPAWGTLAHGVDAALDLNWPASGEPLDWRQWRGEAWAGVRGIDLAGALAATRPWLDGTGLAAAAQSLGIDSGRAGFRLWTFFDPDAANRTILRLAAEGLQARVQAEAVPLAGLRLDARSSHDAAGRTTIVLERLELDDDQGQRFDAGAARPMLRLGANGEPVAARLALADFDAAPVLAWLRRFPLPASLRAPLKSLQAEGRVHRAALSWSNEPNEVHGSFDADFEGLSFAWQHAMPLRPGELRLPGFHNVSGRVHANRDGGRADLHGRDLQLIFPGLFVEPAIALQRFDARASWSIGGPGHTTEPTAGATLPPPAHAPRSSSRSPAPPADAPQIDGSGGDEGGSPALTLRIEAMHFANADAAGELSGTWRSGGHGPGLVDLTGKLDRADARHTARYLPRIVPAEVRDWVHDAIRSGRSDDVRFVVRGDLADFPWRDPATGLFRVEAKLSDGRLAYAPGWPAIERIDGLLRFERAGMQIDARSGGLWRIGFDPVRATIEDFDQPMLRVEGGAAGPAQDLLRFLHASPLQAEVNGIGTDAILEGNAALQLALDVPLHAPQQTKVRGEIRFDGNDVAPGHGLPTFEQLAGRISFTESSAVLHDLSARVLGGAVRFHGAVATPGQLQLALEGEVPASSLARWRLAGVDDVLAGHIEERVSGPIGFTADFERHGPVSSIRLHTDLAGVRSGLPPPFAKAGGERWPVQLVWTSAQAGLEMLDIALPEHARLIVEHDRSTGAEVFRRGLLAIGPSAATAASAAALPAAGFTARIRVSELDLDAWADLSGLRSVPSLPEPGDDLGELVERFPRGLPTLDVAVERFTLGGRMLGALQLQAENDGPADRDAPVGDRRTGDAQAGDAPAVPRWRVRHLQLEHPAGRLDASGAWQARRAGMPAASDLQFSLSVIDGGALLDLFGFPGVLRSGSGELEGRIAWRGSPVHLDTRSLSGDIVLAMGKGQFLKSDPGIAKLIGVLNLQSLRRRLVFDFRDLFAEGFAFDTISGSARIVDGVAHTGDFRMKGVTAQVAIRGQADLAAETQALVVQVRPEFDAGLASLAYAALANPALGLGTFVAQMVLREPLQQMFGHEYDVTGAWDDPQVMRRARAPAGGTTPDGDAAAHPDDAAVDAPSPRGLPGQEAPPDLPPSGVRGSPPSLPE